jgi:hypothetical protein
MFEYLAVLENHYNIDPEIIRATKVKKLLKVILRTTIPHNDEYYFKQRCRILMDWWNRKLAVNGGKEFEARKSPSSLEKESDMVATSRKRRASSAKATREPRDTHKEQKRRKLCQSRKGK